MSGALEEKMPEYIDNGAQLGWLVDPVARQAHIYRRGASVEVFDDAVVISGDPELPKFSVDLDPLWRAIMGRV